MLRGAQKQMIVVRTRDSRVFEEAYFVVRRGKTPPAVCKEDMLFEANRIIERSIAAAGGCGGGAGGGAGSRPPERYGLSRTEAEEPDVPPLRRKGLVRGLWFLLGTLCGGGTVGLLWLLL